MKLTLTRTQFCLALAFLLFVPFQGTTQNWVADSLTVGFGQHPDSILSSLNITRVNDLRSIAPQVISVFEHKKALFFPVDQVVKTHKFLADELEHKFSSNAIASEKYAVNIHQFNIVPSKELWKSNFSLYSSLEVAKISGIDTAFLGTFYYEQSFSQKSKLPVSDGYENLLEEWISRFNSDLLIVGSDIMELVDQPLYHFRKNKHAVNKNFYTGAEFFAGLNFWGVDGEIWFSEPEGNPIFNRTTAMVRYVNHPEFQSIAFGNNVRMWNYRFTDHWLFTHKMAFLLGINNWKDMQTASHRLEEIIMVNLSFTQRITYNRFDQQGLVFGIGLMEDAHYIIYHQPKLKVGLSLSCAYKF